MPDTPHTAAWRMADRLMGGHLAERIAELRAAGRSWDDITLELHTEAGVVVTANTIARWAETLGIEVAA